MQEPSPQVKSVEGHGAKPTEPSAKNKDPPDLNARISHSTVQSPRFQWIFEIKFENQGVI